MTEHNSVDPTYVRRRLRQGAFEYARHMLGLGRTVGKALEPFLSSDVAEAWTLAPENVGDDQLNAYRGGGGTYWKMPLEAYLGVVDARRRALGGATWVVPDGMALSSEVDRDRIRSEIVTAADEVLYVVRYGKTGLDEAWHAAGSAAGQIGLLTRADVPQGSATRSDLSTVARLAELVVISAYDDPVKVIFYERRGCRRHDGHTMGWERTL